MSNKYKQISIVLETSIDFDELNLIRDFNKFLSKYPEIQLTGTHVKKMEKRE